MLALFDSESSRIDFDNVILPGHAEFEFFVHVVDLVFCGLPCRITWAAKVSGWVVAQLCSQTVCAAQAQPVINLSCSACSLVEQRWEAKEWLRNPGSLLAAGLGTPPTRFFCDVSVASPAPESGTLIFAKYHTVLLQELPTRVLRLGANVLEGRLLNVFESLAIGLPSTILATESLFLGSGPLFLSKWPLDFFLLVFICFLFLCFFLACYGINNRIQL